MVLHIKNLSKNFKGLQAINNLSMDIRNSEMLGIIGPNGAGKSTLFNLLTGFLHPNSGEIIFDGKVITNLPSHTIARGGISRTFQTTRVFKDESVLNNVLVGLIPATNHDLWTTLIGRRKKNELQLSRLCEEVLHLIDLVEKSDILAGELDQEEQKRLAIGIAMATNPKLLLLDEPTAGVNIEEINHLVSIIRRIGKSGVTICLIEHKMKVVMELCERIIVLNHGEKIAEGTPQEVRHDEETVKAYLGEEYAT